MAEEYVIERDGGAIKGPQVWGRDMRAASGVLNKTAPDCPFPLPDGRTLRRVVRAGPAPAEYQTTSEAGGVVDDAGEWRIAVTALDWPLDQAKAKMLAKLADVRWQHEVGGTTMGGMHIQTDRETRANYVAAAMAASTDPTFAVTWKLINGTFVNLDGAQIQAAMGAVLAHVRDCYANEQAIALQVEAAADLDALRAIDLTSGWPA